MSEQMSVNDPLLQPYQLRHLHLRNRILSTSHAPSFAEDGHPRDRYRLYHEEKAKGGVALTMIGGSTNISPDSPSVFGQLYAGDDSIIPWFRRLTEGVKSHGAAVMCQITHMGRRTSSDCGNWLPVIGASDKRERAHRSFPKPMEPYDFQRVINHFADAAVRCKEGGFDGIELLSHSHLLGQFLSPIINDRTDGYGGSLSNRLRLTLEVLEAIRDRVGDDFVLGLRFTGDELIAGGLSAEEGIEIAKLLEGSGMVDFLNILVGAPYDDLGLAGWVAPMGNPAPDDLTIVGNIRAAVSLPVFHAGGIADISTARQAVANGKVDMVGMTRAQIADPYLVQKLSSQREEDIRPCVGLGYCVDRVNQGKDVVCGHNAATGREAYFGHIIQRDISPHKKAVVVGGGPAGMEASRVLGERGMNVVLFEASSNLGGQIALAAARGQLRRQIWGVAYWLQSQLERLEVDIRYNCYAEEGEILAEQPDIVIIATGGMPEPIELEGSEFAISSWDVLSGAKITGKVLLFDDHGDHQAAVAADVLAGNGAEVIHLTPDRTSLMELGPTNSAVVLRDLYRKGVQFEVLKELTCIEIREGKTVARLRHTLTGELSEKIIDHVVIERGISSLTEVYEALKPASRNSGIVDIDALVSGQLILPQVNAEGQFDLVRIGDAISSRNLHAAIYDGLRIGSLYQSKN
jgi:2,4-dienoyl-CoA reductase-like NADH-dependent reductase (Old Yellow Enzyme family)/thioredoxin reductase